MDTAPKLKNKFVCIVDRHSPELTAVVSSYLVEEDYYLPLFEIQGVTAPHTRPIVDPPDEHTFSQLRAEEVTTSIRNAIVRLNGCDNIVLVGLSEEQKSYLQLPDGFNVIAIDSFEEVDVYLAPFFEVQKPTLSCHPEEVLKGLQQAVQTGHWLNIDPRAMPLAPILNTVGSCVVIENDDSAMAVMAVNYALSVKVEVIVALPLAEDEERDILYYLADWKQHGDLSARNKIQNAIISRIGGFDFSGYDDVTFFTVSIPYSLLIGSVTCCTYVHMHCGPDHFTFRNILYANILGTGASLVFSPLDFNHPVRPSAQREIDVVSEALSKMNFNVHQLVSHQATAYHLSRYLQHYPYDLLHICSHGGEIPGKRVHSEFVDSAGTTHSVVFDHVMSFSVTPYRKNGESLIEVQRMVFPRSYNGFAVGSDELKAQHYPPEFFVECQNAVIHNTTLTNTLIEEINQVTDSRSVMCSDYPFQGMISYLAGGMKPVIFNNTCWSWGHVAVSFLQKGARGYIGTLWSVKDDSAAASAVTFYEHVQTMPVAKAIQAAAGQHQPAEDENIYAFFGFPFTMLHPGDGRQSEKLVLKQLTRSKESFQKNRQIETHHKVQENLDFILTWHEEVIRGIQL